MFIIIYIYNLYFIGLEVNPLASRNSNAFSEYDDYNNNPSNTATYGNYNNGPLYNQNSPINNIYNQNNLRIPFVFVRLSFTLPLPSQFHDQLQIISR